MESSRRQDDDVEMTGSPNHVSSYLHGTIRDERGVTFRHGHLTVLVTCMIVVVSNSHKHPTRTTCSVRPAKIARSTVQLQTGAVCGSGMGSRGGIKLAQGSSAPKETGDSRSLESRTHETETEKFPHRHETISSLHFLTFAAMF